VNQRTAILVTGATGFIGGRICERIVQAGFNNVRALVHDSVNAPRIARLPIQMCQGDLMHAHSLKNALENCKIVFHLGLGPGRGIATGTRNLLKAAATVGVERIVHISTTAVYGLKPPPYATSEDIRPHRTGNEYSDYKLAAEGIVRQFMSRGLPIVILRPSIVIGPYSQWSVGIVNQLRQGTYLLIDDGVGLCNTTYVDNLVDAMWLAVEKPEAVGQIFTITDGDRVTWGEFIRAHASMLRIEPRFENVSSEDISRHYNSQPGAIRASLKATRRVLASSELRRLLKQIPIADRILSWAWCKTQGMTEIEKQRLRKRLSGDRFSAILHKAPPMPEAGRAEIETVDVLFSIEKARRLLGYSPRVHFPEAMQRTEQWLRFANFLSS